MKKGSMANSEANIPDWEVNNFTNDNDSALKVLKIYLVLKKQKIWFQQFSGVFWA